MSKYCPKCGNELPDDAQFCNECGYSVLVDDNSPVKETPKKVQKTEETENSKKDIDELLFNEAPAEAKSDDNMDSKIFSSKASFNLPKNKILIPVAVIVIIIIGIAIFSSNLFYNPDSISITITDISGTSGESGYYYNVNAIFNNLPSNTQGYFLKTTYYDSNGNALATTTEGLNTVDNSEYGSYFGFYNSHKYLAINHAKIEIIHDGNVVKEATGNFDMNKSDFSIDNNNTTQS